MGVSSSGCLLGAHTGVLRFFRLRLLNECGFRRLVITTRRLTNLCTRRYTLLSPLGEFRISTGLLSGDLMDSNDLTDCRGLVTRVGLLDLGRRLHRSSFDRVINAATCLRFTIYNFQAVVHAPLAGPLARVMTIPRTAIRRLNGAGVPVNGLLVNRYS